MRTDGLRKWTNDSVLDEKVTEALPDVSKGFRFMSQRDYGNLPNDTYIENMEESYQKTRTPAGCPLLHITKSPKPK